MKYLRLFLYFTAMTLLTAACADNDTRYRIGVSQCSEDIWRNWQNAEMKMEANFHDGIELIFASAQDNSERQTQQIDSLVAEGIDLLIVAPNQLQNVSPAIDRAYDKGIPVIVFERKTDSQKYTAFMSADNYEMGRQMGQYIATRMGGKGHVMEILGLKGSSPADERHKGFREVIDSYPQIEVTAELQGDWTEETAYGQVLQYKGDLSQIDMVFGHNDRTAIGARRAFIERGEDSTLTLFCGIDGLAGANGGIQQVRDSLLEASYIYPTRGDLLLKLALDILDGKPYEKETLLKSAIVTHDNAQVLLLESDEVMRQAKNLEQMHQQADNYLKELANQRTLTLLAIGFIILLCLLLAAIYLYFRQKARIAAERTKMEREQLDFYTQVSHQLRTPLTLIEGPLDQLALTDDIRQADKQAADLFAIVRRNTRQLAQLINRMLDAQAGGSIDDDNAAQHVQTTTITTETTDNHLHADTAAHDDTPADDDRHTLLIVDDNADIRAYLRHILKDKYHICEAADGQEGLRVANEQVPDLIVSDVMMPVMNGLEFCQHIKKDMITSHIPVILLTARALSQHQIEGYESGADAYLTKPFSAELLTARIDNLLQSRQRLKVLWGDAEELSEGISEGLSKGQGAGGRGQENTIPITKTNVQTPTSPNSQTPTSPNDQTTKQPSDQLPSSQNAFIERFKKVVEQHLDNSDLSVEDLSAEMHLSRVQLYRKVKALTGYSPIDLLRKARLARAHALLKADNELSVSEIAYQTGFSSPSYFTKCFKDEYGIVPGEARKASPFPPPKEGAAERQK